MKGVLPRATIGRPALRAALVSMEIRTLIFFWKISESNAFCAPAAPLPSSATSSARSRPSTPPLALISSTASSAACTTEGATTLLAPREADGNADLDGIGGRSARGGGKERRHGKSSKLHIHKCSPLFALVEAAAFALQSPCQRQRAYGMVARAASDFLAAACARRRISVNRRKQSPRRTTGRRSCRGDTPGGNLTVSISGRDHRTP